AVPFAQQARTRLKVHVLSLAACGLSGLAVRQVLERGLRLAAQAAVGQLLNAVRQPPDHVGATEPAGVAAEQVRPALAKLLGGHAVEFIDLSEHRFLHHVTSIRSGPSERVTLSLVLVETSSPFPRFKPLFFVSRRSTPRAKISA